MIQNGEQARSICFVEIFETKFLEPSGEYDIVAASNRPIDAGRAHGPASPDQQGGTDLSPIFPGVITAEPVPGFLAMDNGGPLSVGWIVQPIDWFGYQGDVLRLKFFSLAVVRHCPPPCRFAAKARKGANRKNIPAATPASLGFIR
jgi:hypothetical protein